jgi:hypothetical protein
MPRFKQRHQLPHMNIGQLCGSAFSALEGEKGALSSRRGVLDSSYRCTAQNIMNTPATRIGLLRQ